MFLDQNASRLSYPTNGLLCDILLRGGDRSYYKLIKFIKLLERNLRSRFELYLQR